MEIGVLVFLSSGLFLGWSLGANDASHIFGTAVGSRMVRFSTAALLCSVFVILGATLSGAGAAHSLGKLGAVSAIGGAFMVALGAGLSVFFMTKLGLPVSTTQAVVGAIIGWNLFAGSLVDFSTLANIAGSWVATPILSGIVTVIVYKGCLFLINRLTPHILTLDALTRIGLILAGTFGAYSLGANNIANVMGVFVPSSPFAEFNVGDFTVTSTVQLFFLGAVAIAVGVYTYSYRVMMTVGDGIVPLSPVGALACIVGESVTLLLFASEGLEYFLASHGLPTIPLVPVSSAQAVIGSVLGLGIYKGARDIRWTVLGRVVTAWISTPLISLSMTFVGLFFFQNVFQQKAFEEYHYVVNEQVVAKAQALGYDLTTLNLDQLAGKTFNRATELQAALRKQGAHLDNRREFDLVELAKVTPVTIDGNRISAMDKGWLTQTQLSAMHRLDGKSYQYRWQLVDDLANLSPEWQFKDRTVVNKVYNTDLDQKLRLVENTFASNS